MEIKPLFYYHEGNHDAPISSLMMEYYLKKELSEKAKLKMDLIKEAIILNPKSDFTF